MFGSKRPSFLHTVPVANICYISPEGLTFDTTKVPKEGSKSCYQPLMKDKEVFVLELEDVSIDFYPAKRKCEIEMLKTREKLNMVISCFNKQFNKNFVVGGNRGKWECNITAATKLVDSEGTEGQVKDLIPITVKANISLIFFCYLNVGERHLITRVKSITMTNDEPVETEITSLPQLEIFSEMTIDAKRRYYPNANFVEDNTIGYILVEESPGDPRIIDVERFNTRSFQQFIVPSKTELLSKTGLDIDGANIHYSVSLTDMKDRGRTKENFMKAVKEFLQVRVLDIRGLWYDVHEKVNEHSCNLHIVSPLPLEYFKEVMIPWRLAGNKLSIKPMYEPMGWRMHASRNNGKLYNNENKMKNKGQRFYQLMTALHKEEIIDCNNTRKIVDFLRKNMLEI